MLNMHAVDDDRNENVDNDADAIVVGAAAYYDIDDDATYHLLSTGMFGERSLVCLFVF